MTLETSSVQVFFARVRQYTVLCFCPCSNSKKSDYNWLGGISRYMRRALSYLLVANFQNFTDFPTIQKPSVCPKNAVIVHSLFACSLSILLLFYVFVVFCCGQWLGGLRAKISSPLGRCWKGRDALSDNDIVLFSSSWC